MGKGFSDFTYGVGLEISAQSFKQVKDDLKLNLDNLSKMVKSYGKVLKIDPDADLSKLFGEMRKLQGIVDGINNSDNSFAGFVDKGLLGKIETLENSLKSVGDESKEIKSNLSELKSSIASIVEPLKAAGQIKFPATFDNLFGDIQDQSSKIKQTVDQINKLNSSIKELQDSKYEFNQSADIQLDDDVLASQVRSWINEFKTLKKEMSSNSNFDIHELESNVLKLSELGQKINAALGTWGEDAMKNLGFPLDGKDGVALNNFLLSIPKQIDSVIGQIEAKRSELSAQLEQLYAEQTKYDTKLSGHKSSGKSLGIQSDYTAQVKVTPKANDAEWANIINDTIRNIEGQLHKVHLTPTFSKSKDIHKEMEGNLAQINHAVNVDLKVDDNIEKFEERINNIDTSIKNAKNRLEKNGNFKIKFEYEEGGNFKDVAYKIINQLKQVEVHVDKKSTNTFLKELGDLRTKANNELKNIKATVKFNSFNNLIKAVDALKTGIDSKLGKSDIVLNISNEPEVIAQATLIRDKLISLFGKVPVNLGINTVTSDVNTNTPSNTVEQLSEAAQEAQTKLEKCRQTLASLQNLGFNSPHFLELGDITPDGKRAQDSTKRLEELLNKYKALQSKLPVDLADRWQELYPEANGNISIARRLAQEAQSELKKVEAELKPYLQKQMAYTQSRYDYYDKIIQQEKELGAVQKTSADNAVENTDTEKIKKVKADLLVMNNLLKDLQSNGFKSSEFLNLGDIDADGNKVEASTKRLKRLLTEYENLKKRTTKEKGAGNNQWLEKYPKAKGDMGKVQQLIEKDEKRIQKIESELNQYAQKQIAFLSSRKSALQQVLATEEQITSENTKQAHANKTDISASSMNQQLAMSAEEAAKKVKSLNTTLTQQKKVLKDLEEKGINSKSFIKLGEWDKKTGGFKKNKEEIQQLVSRYNELKAAREKAGSKKAVGEEASLRGKLAAILRQQKQHVTEIITQNQTELKTAKEISAAYREAASGKKKSSKDKTDVDVGATTQKIEQLSQKLNKAKAALSNLKDGLSAVASTGLGDNKKVLKDAGKTETLKQLVSLYEQLTVKKKAFEDGGISKQSVPEMNSLIDSLNQAKQILDKKGLFGLSETGLGDVKGRLVGSSQSLNELVSQYRELLTVKQQLEKSGDTTSESYISTVNTIKGIESQLKVLRQDQVQEVNSRIQGLEAEIAKKTEYLNVVKECGAIEGVLADVHKNQVDYATSRIDLYTQQIAKEQELLQIAKQREQEEAKQVNKQKNSDGESAKPVSGAAVLDKATSTVKLDGATLSSLAKDSTLQSIDGKIGNILSSLNGDIKISGSNIVVEASNVTVSGKTSGDTSSTTGNSKKTNVQKQTNANQNLAAGAEKATKEQKKLNAELQETQQLSDMALSQTTAVVSEAKHEIKKLTETYKSGDKVSERTEISGWVSHGKEEPPTFEHVSTVYKTNMEAYNKIYNDYIKSLAKQMELKAKIQSDDGPTSKMQAELSIQEDITNQLELQLQRHSELYTEQAKQEATLEAAKKAQQEINKSEGAKKDRDVKKQNNELLKIVQSAQNKLSEMQYGMQSSKIPMADGAIAKLKQYEQLLSTLKLKQQELLLNPDLLKDADYSNNFNSLLQQMDAVETEFTELQKSSSGFLSKISSIKDIKQLGAAFDPSNLEQMRDVMQEFADQAGSSAAKLIEFNDAERSATFEISDGHGHIQQLTVAYDAATNSLGRYTSKTRESTSETKKFLSSLKHSFQNVARYIASFGSVYELFSIVRQGVTYVRDIDSALTELKKVTDETDASYANFLQDMSSVGKTVGATVKDLTTMSAEWSRLGYSMQEAGQLAKSTAILMNVSEFDDATKASEALISTMQAFQYTADESGHVVDILNEVGNNYAVSSDGIATALQDSASALMEGGNNLEQAVALVAAANRVVQDPNSVGSALRTISLRLRGTSVEILEEMGEETDGVVESTSKLQEKIEALSGVNILTDAGEYKDTYTILKEIGTVWKDMSDIDQAALLELMAGKNRANTLSAILSNMTDLKGAYESALNAEGSALKENEAYLDSIQGRIDLFNNSVQTMWMNTISSDTVKGFVNLGTNLIGIVDKLGLVESLIAGIFTYFTTFSKYKIDLASILGIHDLDAGWFAKSAKINNGSDVVNNILGDPSDIKKSVENFADNIRTNINDYVTIDTSQIDSQIKSVQDRLDTLRPQLDYAVKHKKDLWYRYKDSGSKSPAKDRDNAIAKQRAEINALEQDLIRLQQQRDNIVSTAIDSTLNSKVQAYQSMLSVLDQVKDTKLYIGGEQDAAAKIDAMSTAAQKGQVDLTNYVSALSDTDIALKAYAASVKDGNYSLAGFQQFIQQHNAGIKASGIAAKTAAVGHQLLNAALSMGLSLIASFAIDAIIKGLDELIVTNDELIQQADELQNAYSSQFKTIQENLSTLQGLKDEFDELSKGVDDYGNNISLAADDYERYQSIVTDIVGISPGLIDGYNAEGNAIANKNGLLAESIRLMQEEQRLNAQKLTSNDNLETIAGSVQAKLENYKKEKPLSYGDAKYNFTGEFAKAIRDDDNYHVFEALSPDGYAWRDYSGGAGDFIYAQNFASDFYDAIVADLRSEESKLESYFTEEQRENMLNYAYEYDKNVQAYNHDVESINSELNSTLQTVPLAETSYYTLSDEMKGYLTQYIDGLDVTADNLLEKKQDIIDLTKIISNNRDLQSTLSSAFKTKIGKDEDGETLNYKDYQEEVSKIIQEIDKFDYTDEQKKTIFDFIGLDAESKEFNNKISEAATHAKNLLQDRFDAHVGDLSVTDILITTKITEDPNSLTFDELEEKIEDIKNATTQDFDITKYTKTISAHSAEITKYQEALQKLGKGSFTMDDFVALVEEYPDLAKGVDISSNAFYGLSRNLNRAIKSKTKNFIKDLKELKKSLESAGKSTDVIDQLVEAVENMPDDALSDVIQRYGTLADEIERARLAQDQLIASMEENPNEGYETRGEAMEYMKAAMKRGEIGSESNLWNVAERYGFTYDSAKTINENADALADYIAVRDTWYKQDDDGNYTYEGTENFIEAVEKVVDTNDDLAKILDWNYDESTGVFDFDFKNENLPTIISLLGQTKELIGLTEQEWSDMMVQVGQYFGIDWSNYQDAKDHLDEIANSTSDAKTKVEEYGQAMQDYFGAETSIDLTKRPMVSKEAMQAAGWNEFDGEYATLFSGGYSNADDTVAVTVTPILPDGEVLGPGALAEYANQLAEGTEPAELKFQFKGKEYTGEDIFLKKTTGKDASQIDDDYGLKLSEAQAQYDQLRDRLNINATINESGINGLREISELQDAIQEKSDGTVVINEDAFRSVLADKEYTEDQIDLLVEKIKYANSEAFNFDFLNLDDVMLNKGIDGLKEVVELQNAIREDAETGLTIVNTDMFATILDGAGYSKERINELIDSIKTYDGVIAVSGSADPLGLNALNGQIDPLIASLNTLGIEYKETVGVWGDGLTDIKINVPDLVSTLKANNWTDEAIKAYCAQLSATNIKGFQVKVDPTEVDAAIAKANEMPEDKPINVEITGNGLATAQSINSELDKMQDKTIDVTINETTVKSVEEAEANGTAWWNPFGWFANGTAHATGSWGAPETETALVGELGPELLVRNGRWTTIGDNGAEFAQVKKGDIIFNHKQTEQLLKNGYVTGRGKLHGGAFASGTAFSSGGGTFGRYEFDGEGGWVEYDVNNKIVDSLNNAAAALGDAAEDASASADEFKEVFDWIEVRLEEINEDISLKSAELENAVGSSAQNAIIGDMVSLNHDLYENLLAGSYEYYNYSKALLEKLPEQYREAAQDGAIAIEQFAGEADEKTLEAIQEYREWVQKGADATQQAEEVLTEIQNLAKQAFDNIVTEFENKLSLNDSKVDRFDAENSLLETDKGFESENIYQAMIDENESKLKILAQQRDAMQAELDTGKIKEGTDAWYEAVNAIAGVDTEIVNLQTEVEDLQDSINELHWEKFEVLMKQFEAINDEAENLLDILGQDDAVDEFGKWTDKGVTSLGLLAQRMEVAEMQAQQYKEEIEYLNKNWEKLGYTQEEYIDKLDELKSGQYDAINAYHDAKDAIVDLNKERVEAIKDGIEKEIDAYEELINKKKEALDADKDAHDWQKSVAKQQKNISDIERQIAALSSDNSISARAKRAKLEADLLEAKAEMDEMYYDRTVEKQKEALDEELESFQETKENEIEDWEKYLENVELVVADTIGMVQESTQTVLETLTILGQEFGLTITEALTNPWKAGETAIQNYGEKLNMSLAELAALFGLTVDEFAAKLDLTTEGLVSKLDITVAEMATSLGLTEEQLATKLGLTTADLSGKMSMTIQQFAASIGYTIPQLAQKLGTTTSGLVGNLDMTMTQFAGRLGLTVDQLAGKFGLTTKGLAAKLGQTYQQLTNPFGMSMSSTVDALKSLEKEYSKILNDLESQSLATVSRVNHAMEKYTSKSNNKTSTSTAQKTVTLGSRINAGNAKIYSDSYGGGAGTQYYGNDPIYTVIGENNGYWLVRHHKLSSGYTGWFKKSDVKAYAKGTKGVKEDQLALIDELGEELRLIPDGHGRLAYMKKGTGVVPADLTANLMEWGKLDPSTMLDQNRPQIGVSPSVVNNTTEIHIDASVGELIHVEHLDGNNPAEISKIVDKAWDKRMKELNGFVRKYSR